jgi:hypothetical protein
VRDNNQMHAQVKARIRKSKRILPSHPAIVFCHPCADPTPPHRSHAHPHTGDETHKAAGGHQQIGTVNRLLSLPHGHGVSDSLCRHSHLRRACRASVRGTAARVLRRPQDCSSLPAPGQLFSPSPRSLPLRATSRGWYCT